MEALARSLQIATAYQGDEEPISAFHPTNRTIHRGLQGATFTDSSRALTSLSTVQCNLKSMHALLAPTLSEDVEPLHAIKR